MKGWEFSLEGYYKKTDNVLEYVDGRLALSSSVNWEDNVAMGEGRAYGLELYARKVVGKTTGTLAYTLSKAERIFRDGSINDGRWFPAQFDRRHVINATVNHKFNSRIDLTASWAFLSGNCMTIPTRGSAFITPDGDDVAVDYVSGRNNYRLPPTHHLDVSVNFRKQNATASGSGISEYTTSTARRTLPGVSMTPTRKRGSGSPRSRSALSSLSCRRSVIPLNSNEYAN